MQVNENEIVSVNEDGNVKVEISWIGEGVSGDYQESDPNDEPLMRFDVYKLEDGEWEAIEDASYCTNLNANLPVKNLQAACDHILSIVADDLESGYSIKKVCENLSWIDETVFGTYQAQLAA